WDEEYAKKRINDEIDSKRAFNQMKRWIAAQGGNEEWLENTALFPKAPITAEFKAEKSGYISCVNAEKIGLASYVLGAGRAKKDDVIDLFAGIVLRYKTGDYVNKGSTLAVTHTSCDTRLKMAEEYLTQAFQIGETKPQKHELIIKTIL
ncbi:MAG: pyrimidine-nucleoside phosphorylase, partial [Eubacteriales bacterium]|nr:pyrimidine-nucleoside phosphorylase [Eubacteriales bacterium]